MKFYSSILFNFNILLYGGADTKTEYNCDLGYLHTFYEVDPGAFPTSRSPGFN